jgi:hypothetical protein
MVVLANCHLAANLFSNPSRPRLLRSEARTTHRPTPSEHFPASRYVGARVLVACLCVAVKLVGARVQDYFAIPDFHVRDSVLVGIFDNVTAQRRSYSE